MGRGSTDDILTILTILTILNILTHTYHTNHTTILTILTNLPEQCLELGGGARAAESAG